MVGKKKGEKNCTKQGNQKEKEKEKKEKKAIDKRTWSCVK
jgi:hypothetical protein